jgi:hypothetical protein
MSTLRQNTKLNPTRRRGAFAVLLMLFVAIGIVAGGLAINWAYGVLVQRDMHHKTDAFALAGGRALLHPALLAGGATPMEMMEVVNDAIADTLAASNAASPTRLKLNDENLTVTIGHVADVTQKVDSTTFVDSTPYNTVRVAAKREQADGNPVTHLINQFGSHTFAASEVGAISYATLDNHVIGMLPTADAAAPVVPVAIDAMAWANEQFIDNNIGTPGVEKFMIRLFCGGMNPATPNTAVVGFNGPVAIGTNPNTPGTAPYQITHGLVPSDLPGPNHMLGPIAGVSPPLVLAGRQTLSSSECSTMVAQFNAMSQCRVFMLAAPAGGDFRITALVAARVLNTTIDSDHLLVTIEKCFVVHPTVLTSPLADGPNPLVHKLRISR